MYQYLPVPSGERSATVAAASRTCWPVTTGATACGGCGAGAGEPGRVATTTAAAAAAATRPAPRASGRTRRRGVPSIRFCSRYRLRSTASWGASLGASAARRGCRSNNGRLLGESGGELLAGTRQPGADRARGDAECFGHFGVPEVAERDEEQDIALSG